jgi:hypothetical protein
MKPARDTGAGFCAEGLCAGRPARTEFSREHVLNSRSPVFFLLFTAARPRRRVPSGMHRGRNRRQHASSRALGTPLGACGLPHFLLSGRGEFRLLNVQFPCFESMLSASSCDQSGKSAASRILQSGLAKGPSKRRRGVQRLSPRLPRRAIPPEPLARRRLHPPASYRCRYAAGSVASRE